METTTLVTLVPIWLALIVAIPALLAPLLMAMLNNRNRRQEKQEDYDRLDEVAEKAAVVAAKAAEVARLVAEKADEVAAHLLKANERAEKDRREILTTAQATNVKIDVVHTLVNSNMTAAMQAELDSRVIAVAMMQEVSDLKKAAGGDPNGRSLVAIAAANQKIVDLTAALDRRQAQQVKLDGLAEVKAGYAAPKEE